MEAVLYRKLRLGGDITILARDGRHRGKSPLWQISCLLKRVTRRILVIVSLASAAFGQADPKALVTQSVKNYNRDWRAAMSWTYTVTDITNQDGVRHVNVSEV